jgi:hypothetical protein
MLKRLREKIKTSPGGSAALHPAFSKPKISSLKNIFPAPGLITFFIDKTPIFHSLTIKPLRNDAFDLR